MAVRAQGERRKMEGRAARACTGVPVIDVGPLVALQQQREPADEQLARERRAVAGQMVQASQDWGFFQIVNHAIPLPLIDTLLSRFRDFCALPHHHKLQVKQKPDSGSPTKFGYVDDDYTKGVLEHRERLSFCLGPWEKFNVWPHEPSNLSALIEAYMDAADKMTTILVELLFEGLGISSQSINKKCLDDRSAIFMLHHYHPSENTSTLGATPHKDASIVTLLFQDEVGGLEVSKDGEWFEVTPRKGALVINVGDVFQVWSNGKLKSVTHRVWNGPVHRYSMPFFFNAPLDFEVSPLVQFCTTEAEVAPKYHPFIYKDYLHLRLKNKELTTENKGNKHHELGVEYYEL